MGNRGRKSAAELAVTRLASARVVPRTIKPPRPLGEAGRKLWGRLTAAYDFSSPGGAEVLAQACAAADLAEETKDDKLKLQARAFVARTIARLCE
jgi:hypothetical protein